MIFLGSYILIAIKIKYKKTYNEPIYTKQDITG